MLCDPGTLRRTKVFALLDDEEAKVLADQVELKSFEPRQRIYKMGETGGKAYVLVSGAVEVTSIDEDGQEFVVDRPGESEFFGFASMLDAEPHQTSAYATSEAVCIEVEQKDIALLLEKKPHAGMDILAVVARQYHTSHHLVRSRSERNANDIIDEKTTAGERLADAVARFAGSWPFIVWFLVTLVIYSIGNVFLGQRAWDPYPFILLNLILSMLAAIQAPVIMMSQNRQDTRDRVRSELDYQVNRRAHAEIQGLARKLNSMDEKINDIEQALRRTEKPKSLHHE
jgi:CRP/FNR family cyclic AMP-dependent transcriptional regulator